jgi:hypothetical protein
MITAEEEREVQELSLFCDHCLLVSSSSDGNFYPEYALATKYIHLLRLIHRAKPTVLVFTHADSTRIC